KSSLQWAVELRLGKICRSFAQYLVGLTKLAVLSFQSLHLLRDIARQSRSLAAVHLGLLHPLIQRVCRAADLGGNRRYCSPSRRIGRASCRERVSISIAG